MAITGSFKQQCPSCEANVLIKDGTLIGKKVDCPKCKYRFVVEDPAAKDKKAVAAATEVGKKKDPTVKAKATAKETIADEELVEAEEEEAPEPKKGGKASASKRPRDKDEEDESPKKKKKKPKESNKKLMIGVGLAGVGLIVLAVAAFLLLGGSGTPAKIASGKGGSTGGAGGGGADKSETDPKNKSGDPKNKNKSKNKDSDKDNAPEGGGGQPAGSEITNFLPPASDAVYHCFFKDFLASPIGTTALGSKTMAGAPGAFSDAELKAKLGFSVFDVDDILTAESFSQRWTFHVVHTTRPIEDMRPLIVALDLQEWSDTSTKYKCYVVSPRSSASILALAKLPLFVPAGLFQTQHFLGLPVGNPQQEFLLHMRDPQTMIFAHKKPMTDYLQAKGTFQPNKANIQAARKSPPIGGPWPLFSDGFLSIKPQLREILMQMESRYPGEKVLVSAATDLRPPGATGKGAGPIGLAYYSVRPIWDALYLLGEARTNRIEFVGTSLVMKDPITYAFNNKLACKADRDAKDVQQELVEKAAPEVVTFFGKVVGHRIDLVDDSIPKPPPPEPKDDPRSKFGQPQPPTTPAPPPGPVKDEAKASRVKVASSAKNVDFTIDLLLGDAIENMKTVVQLLAIGLKAEALAAMGMDGRWLLAEAGKKLGEEGEKASGGFPPGVFKGPSSAMRTAREPGQRISWMAGLLPYLQNDALSSRINFDKSWRDGENWMAARTLVPQFLDPSFPLYSRYVTYPGMPVDCAATHFVGIAGVGLEAAEAKNGDQAMAGKLGIFGYDRATSLKSIGEKGRGLANTVLMIRVPFDGAAGTTPWMAGGGSTVRSVPDKNSLEPFLSTDAKGERGTFVLMADGSVRYLKKGMSDDAFKAICTVGTPMPENWQFGEEEYPLMLPPKVAPPRQVPDRPIPPEKGAGEGTGKQSSDVPITWVQYTSKEGGFKISMPAGAVEGSDQVSEGRFSGAFAVFQVEMPDGKGKFTAGCLKMPPGTTEDIFSDHKTFLNNQMKNYTVTEENIKLGNAPGREYQLDSSNEGGRPAHTVMCRAYMIKDLFIAISFTSDTSNKNSPEWKAFAGSLKPPTR